MRLNSFFFIFLPFCSFIFFFFHFLFFNFSFSLIFFHFLSFSFISFIFFEFLSFSLSLLGAQKLFFSGLNFVTISLDSSFVKNQFGGPSRVVPLWALFSFFSDFFSTVFFFFCLFLAFYFSFFLIFCSFLHFLIFNVFHFLFSLFRRKSFFFSFFLYFLALVSEFNCRCSMEMWCPDDIGRDSWDWVGPPAWGEHASTPQSGVEAPRL